MRVVTWNVRSLRDGGPAVAATLRDLVPDLVCLQEAPRLFGWRASRLLLTRRSGLRPLTRTRGCGNLLLAGPGVRLIGSGTIALPRRPGLHRRAAVYAHVEVAGRPLVLAGTHLDLDADARLDSAWRVRDALPAGVLVLGADVNDGPGSAPWATLAAGLEEVGGGPTFPARSPSRRIDALLVDPALEVVAREVVDVGRASDHLAVRADLRWR